MWFVYNGDVCIGECGLFSFLVCVFFGGGFFLFFFFFFFFILLNRVVCCMVCDVRCPFARFFLSSVCTPLTRGVGFHQRACVLRIGYTRARVRIQTHTHTHAYTHARTHARTHPHILHVKLCKQKHTHTKKPNFNICPTQPRWSTVFIAFAKSSSRSRKK